jgi:mannose-6-phosphate isomerase-like protein (cupin superfamily)/CDGSH-type Zn-finger protein
MAMPQIAHRKGFYFEVKAGRRYLWCSCGRSASQPFCDGSHVGTEFSPVLFVAEQDEDVIFCGCKYTGTRPFCDGAHNNLPGATVLDDPQSPANRVVKDVPHGAVAEVPLDGTCFVFSPARASRVQRGTMEYCAIVTPSRGALFQSQFYAEIGAGVSPVIGANGRHTVLFVTEGQGQVEISGRRFDFASGAGFYVAPYEAFRLHNANPQTIKLFISNGPGVEELDFLEDMPDNFDRSISNRSAKIDTSLRNTMGERYFQILVNREQGSTEMTQFVGNIPLSKLEPHRHLYEEVLIFLNGTGVVWTETAKTTVSAGDVLFLPRKQIHSVQCTSEGGLDVVGVIYPGDNPSISY